jgi:beta-glucosidase
MSFAGRAGLALALALSWSAPAHALDPGLRACQAAIADSGRQLLQRSADILATCERAVITGSLPAGTDCVADPAIRQRRTAAAALPLARIQAVCSDAQVSALAPGGDCSEAQTVAALSACIRGSHEGMAESLTDALGTGAAALTLPAQMCAAGASAETRLYSLSRLRLLQLCKASPLRLLLLPGTDCTSEPHTAQWIAIARLRAAARIASDCGPAALAQTSFGAPCGAATDGAALAQCLLSVADAATDTALAAEYPDPGFCGDGGAAVDARIDALLSQMSLAEKVDQMHGASLQGISHTDANPRLNLPGLVMVDGARGVGVVEGHATAFPVGMARGATWDTALETRVGEAIGREARAKGVTVLLAPTMNILRHPRWGRAQETYGEDTLHLGRMATAFIRGAQQHVITSAKHFAGNSIENTRFSVDVTIDERSLREVYLPHFRAAVQQGHTGSVMSAYNLVNGEHCDESVHLLHDILKGDWRFPGFVESDWVFGTHSTILSALAGLDIEMPTAIYYGQPLIDAVTAGQVPPATIDGAVRRILRAQLCFRLDTDPPVVDPTQIETAAHLDLARTVADEAIVLLKNSDALLPLDAAHAHSIVVVGPLASVLNIGDLGSSTVSPSQGVTAIDGIRARAGAGTVTYLPAAPATPADQAVVAAADAVVVVVGLTFVDEGEGLIAAGDRKSLVLPNNQDDLITGVAALNPHTIVLLEGSGPVVMPWIDDIGALLMAWYPGEEGGDAIADVLFGDVTPSGKLPLTFPRAEADLPVFDNTGNAVTYGYYHGYRYIDHNGVAPLFPFGFGLSYTTFAYSNLTVSPATLSLTGHLRVTADITNTGSVAGDEIAQLYVSYLGSSVDRAIKDLKGFARLHLEPGETTTAVFDVRAADLAFWDVATNGWEVEPISYVIRVGPSSADLPLDATVTVSK